MTVSLVLQLENVTKTFGSFIAVDNIDLNVERGQIFGFLGPNGAGKTTTLRMISGLLRPTKGTIKVCSVDAVVHPLEAKQRIGFISDRPFLYEKLTGAEFLRFVGGLWGMAKQDIQREGDCWLEFFELKNWAGEPLESYSHGMRQRLLLCATLMHKPDLVIMDEPMVGLDPKGAAQLKKILRSLAEKKSIAVLLSTHSLDVAEQVCDQLAIIDGGKIIARGSLEEVRHLHHADGKRLEELFLQLTEHGDQNRSGEHDGSKPGGQA
ncbi:MAG: ABC transporter ATP-binding protein [Pseudomonadota bacterium]